MEASAQQPSEFRRALWVYAALALFISLTGPSNLLSVEWWQRQEVGALAELLIPAMAGVSLGLLFSRDIWRLVVRRAPLWKVLIAGALAIAVLGALIFLRESGIWLWSFDFGDTLALSLLGTMALVTALTERKKRVRVYAFARHFTFVRREEAA